MQQDFSPLNFDFDLAAVEAMQAADCDRLRATANVPDYFENEIVEDAVKRVYLALDYPAPKVVRGRSPLSIVYMQAIVQSNLDAEVVNKLWLPASWCAFDATEHEIQEFRRQMLADLTRQLSQSQRTELDGQRAYVLNVRHHVASRIFDARKSMLERFDSVLAPYIRDQKLMRLKRNYREMIVTAERDDFSFQTKRSLVQTVVRQLPCVRDELLQDIPAFIESTRFRAVVPMSMYIEGHGIQREFVQSVVSAAVLLGVAHESYGEIPFYDFLSRTIGFPINVDDRRFMDALLNLYRVAPFFIFDEGVCFISDPPSHREVDTMGRLHSESGPALSYSDGTQTYYWHGSMVPKLVVEDPQSISIDLILQETNTEIRRVMIERFGVVRFLEESNAPLVHEDEFGMLYRQTFVNDEPLVMVRVKNSTPEPDGTIRDYFLRVPPHIRTAREAVAWTFDVRPSDYGPDVET